MKSTCPVEPGEQPRRKAKGGLLERLKAIRGPDPMEGGRRDCAKDTRSRVAFEGLLEYARLHGNKNCNSPAER